MNGNITKEGITADLEAMKRIGIQEAQIFNVKLSLPQGPVKYLSPDWLVHIKFAANEAKRLGLELAFHNAAGWSSSGGPWITPEYAMQTVVCSELAIEGGQIFSGTLPHPKTRLNHYRDIAVLAFPKPKKNIRIDGLDFKSLTGRVRNHLLPDTKAIPTEAIISKNDIVDLSAKVLDDGVIEWEVPDGEWIILRLGHTPVGKTNHPAPESGRGLECDKMSKKAVDVFWEGGLEPIIQELGDMIGSVVTNCVLDSYEVGTTNWTSGFDRQFEKLRGYDCKGYLPTLAGYYVGSGEITERFLWDFRRTIGDLMAENYYAYFGKRCREVGMKFSVEPYWGPFDNMQVGATGDIVMCEFWSGGHPFFDSPKFVSSIANLNGSSIVGAEAFTGIGGWDVHPAMIKSIGDRAWAQGINRFIFHSYVHQPWDLAPGLALSYHGTEFNRLNTWWEQSRGFMDYIARSQFLLQQGKAVADILVFTGESSPNNAFLLPEIQSMGYDYDLIGVNKIDELSVEGGQICTPVGGKYLILVLPELEWMRPETLTKLEQLAKAGATIIGTKPQKSPSLKDYPSCDNQVEELSEMLWSTELINDISIIKYLEKSAIPADFSVTEGDATDISFIHRKTDNADIYFIANARKEKRREEFRFRVTGKQPELWNAQSGKITDLAVWQESGNGTIKVPIQLGSEEALFVIFRKPVRSSEHIVNAFFEVEGPQALPLSNLKILKAEYGTFLQEGLVDITGIVKSKVINGKLDILANRMLCDCDPAMGYKKEFRMEYQVGDSIRQIMVMETEPVKIDAGNKGDLKILKAVFGKFKPETKGVPKSYQSLDVTEKIQEKLSRGRLEFPINNMLIDGKTVEGNKAALRITYLTDGKEQTVYIPKGKTLNLSRDIPESKLISESGNVSWCTPYPGKITYKTSYGKTETVEVKSVPKPIDLPGAWEVSFPVSENSSTSIMLNELASWTASSNEDIRYFSGTASYKKQFNVPEQLFRSGNSLQLDLGSVKEIAEVFVNGKKLGVLWKAPFRLNIDDFVQEGINKLEVKITNLWPNRLIGDEQLLLDYQLDNNKIMEWPDWLMNDTERPSERVTFASWKHWDKDAELQTSGLLGPVRIIVSKVLIIE